MLVSRNSLLKLNCTNSGIATRLTGVAIQALIVYTGEHYISPTERHCINFYPRIPDSTLEDASVAQVAYLDKPSPIRIRSADGK